jgi:hypothetical protein
MNPEPPTIDTKTIKHTASLTGTINHTAVRKNGGFNKNESARACAHLYTLVGGSRPFDVFLSPAEGGLERWPFIIK